MSGHGAKRGSDGFDAGKFVPAFHDLERRLQLHAGIEKITHFLGKEDDLASRQPDVSQHYRLITGARLGTVRLRLNAILLHQRDRLQTVTIQFAESFRPALRLYLT